MAKKIKKIRDSNTFDKSVENQEPLMIHENLEID